MGSPPEQSRRPECLFRSFWIAGFESACHINRAGVRLDMTVVTQHDRQAAEDYARLRTVGIRTAREAARWHLIERDDRFDFSSLVPMVEAARAHDIQIIWNLCHYGWPEGLDIFSEEFVGRFARYCRAVAAFFREHGHGVPVYAPINEISFFAWAIGHRGIFFPYAVGRDEELKRQLVRAALAGCDALWDVDPRARVVHADPVIHVVPPRGKPELAAAAAAQREAQFDAWDMLAGRRAPELGGHPRYLDVVGVNFYHANEWEHPDVRLRWEDTPRDERWVPFHRLLAEVYERYRRPLFVAETSHFGVGRAPWLREMADEVRQALRAGVPVHGICLYPIVDRPDWDDFNHWHNSGLWDIRQTRDGHFERVLNSEYAAELSRAQALLAGVARC